MCCDELSGICRRYPFDVDEIEEEPAEKEDKAAAKEEDKMVEKNKIDEAEEADDLELVNELEIQMWVDGKERTPQDLDPDMRNLVLDMNLIALKSDDSFWELEVEIDPPASDR